MVSLSNHRCTLVDFLHTLRRKGPMLFQIICLTNPIFVDMGITKSGTPENSIFLESGVNGGGSFHLEGV